ncbi:MAG TPA: ribosome silencing factor [Planctomycetota bacterium]|nr:ribosome silencing factor [Planctomycetota bacterium]
MKNRADDGASRDDAPVDGPARRGARPSPREAADLAVRTIVEKKGRNVLLLDISECSDLGDYMILATAKNSRQTYSIAMSVDRALRDAGLRRLNATGQELGVWAILDFGDVFIHVMQERERRYYDLEALWADADVVARIEGEDERAAPARIDASPDDAAFAGEPGDAAAAHEGDDALESDDDGAGEESPEDEADDEGPARRR